MFRMRAIDAGYCDDDGEVGVRPTGKPRPWLPQSQFPSPMVGQASFNEVGKRRVQDSACCSSWPSTEHVEIVGIDEGTKKATMRETVSDDVVAGYLV